MLRLSQPGSTCQLIIWLQYVGLKNLAFDVSKKDYDIADPGAGLGITLAEELYNLLLSLLCLLIQASVWIVRHILVFVRVDMIEYIERCSEGN